MGVHFGHVAYWLNVQGLELRGSQGLVELAMSYAQKSGTVCGLNTLVPTTFSSKP